MSELSGPIDVLRVINTRIDGFYQHSLGVIDRFARATAAAGGASRDIDVERAKLRREYEHAKLQLNLIDVAVTAAQVAARSRGRSDRADAAMTSTLQLLDAKVDAFRAGNRNGVELYVPGLSRDVAAARLEARIMQDVCTVLFASGRQQFESRSPDSWSSATPILALGQSSIIRTAHLQRLSDAFVVQYTPALAFITAVRNPDHGVSGLSYSGDILVMCNRIQGSLEDSLMLVDTIGSIMSRYNERDRRAQVVAMQNAIIKVAEQMRDAPTAFDLTGGVPSVRARFRAEKTTRVTDPKLTVLPLAAAVLKHVNAHALAPLNVLAATIDRLQLGQ
jgi:hypothetical protein